MALILVVVTVAAVLIGGIHYYLWRRLVRDTTIRGGAARRVGTVLVVLLGLSVPGAFVASRALPVDAARFFAWPGYLWVAMVLYLLLALLVGEIARPVLHRALARRGSTGCARPALGQRVLAGAATGPSTTGPAVVAAGAAADGDTATAGSAVDAGHGSEDGPPEPAAGAVPDASRRLFVARSIALAAGAAATATVGHGAFVGLGPPHLKRVTVPLAKLDPRAHGFRIAVVSDIHIGPILGRSHTLRVVDTINRTSPDLVAVVGDLVDGSVGDLGPAAEPLARLKSRHGTFFVTGNHEYFSGAQEWVDHLRTLEVHPLENARVEIGTFDLAGVNDVAGEDEGQGPDFTRALGDRDPSRASVLLAHQPVQIHEAVEHNVDLQLSGHTHGGQMWPGTLLAGLANPTVAGLERYGDTQLYVTRGAGFWGPPVRVGAPPDITVVELASPRA